MAAGLIAGATAAAAALPLPVGAPLPRAVEAMPSYMPQHTCDPTAKPGVIAFRDLLLKTYPVSGSLGITRACSIGDTSEHKEGRAFDWAVRVDRPDQKAAADAVIAWLTATDAAGNVAANARRIGIMYIVWNRKIWSPYRASEGWRAYAGPSPHTDHVHFSFTWAGAAKTTSFWTSCTDIDAARTTLTTRTTSTYCATPLLKSGSTGVPVTVLQRALGITRSGVMDTATVTAVKTRQTQAGLAATGVVDTAMWTLLGITNPTALPGSPAATWPKLTAEQLFATTLRRGSTGAAVAEAQRRLGVTQDGVFGAGTETAVKEAQARASLGQTGIVDVDTWLALGVPPTPKMVLARYQGQDLAPGSSGQGVSALQTFLKLPATGWYGPLTEAAIRRLQDSAGLPVTGSLDDATWTRLLAS